METVIKAFMSIFFCLCTVILSVGFISASINARNADMFLSDAVAKIENSNYSSSVIAAVEADAKEHSPEYDIQVNVYQAKNDATKKYGTATLKYHYRIGFISLDELHELHADIR